MYSCAHICSCAPEQLRHFEVLTHSGQTPAIRALPALVPPLANRSSTKTAMATW